MVPSTDETIPFWSTATPEEIEQRLLGASSPLDGASTRAIRDRVATFLMSDPSRALHLSGILLDAVERNGSAIPAEARATAWRCRAEACLFSGQMKAAGDAYKRATAEAESVGDLSQLGQILVGRVHHLSLIGDTERAHVLARRAEGILKRVADYPYLGKLFMNMGNACYQKDQYADALRAYAKAARIFERIGVRDATWCGLLMNQGIANAHLSRPREARKLLVQAAAESEKRGLAALAADAKYNRALLETLRGDYRQALTLLESAGAVFEEQHLTDMLAACQRARAEIYIDLGMPNEASELAHAAVRSFSSEGMGLDASLARLQAARSLLDSDKAEEAYAILEEAASFFKQNEQRHQLAQTCLLLARAELAMGAIPQALQHAGEALETFETLELHRGVLESRRLAAEALLASGQPEKADGEIEAGRSIARKVHRRESPEFWRTAGHVCRVLGRRGEASAHFRRAARLVEHQRCLIPGIGLRSGAFEEQVKVYHDLVMLHLESPRLPFRTLFKLVETARARGFRERAHGRGLAALQKLADMRELLGSLTRRIEEVELSGKAHGQPAAVADLRRQARQVERGILEESRRSEAQESSAARWTGAVDPGRIAERLGRDETLIEYFVAGEKVLALILRRELGRARILPTPASVIRGHVEMARFQTEALALSTGRESMNVDFMRGSAEATLDSLYRDLIQPLEDLLPAEGAVLVVPHAFLHGVPFECLHRGRAPIGERYRLSRSPTADFLIRPRRIDRRAGRRILVSGLVSGGPEFVRAEIESVARCLPADETVLLKDASTREILSGLRESRIVHVSTHGAFRADNPLFSRLSTVDGAIFAADVLGIDIRADLIVLSACETGRVLTGRGDDLSGVAHAFLAAGVRSLLATHWRVHDEATRTFMESFYRAYLGAARRDPVVALYEAQEEVRSQFNHPFYWGGFGIHGTWAA